MFYLRYIAAELRRRKGGTVLTALGLAVGVGLVVTVVALSKGLDEAQSKVLEPLTGVGTDMSVSRPIAGLGLGQRRASRRGAGAAAPQLSAKEQQELRKENGGARLGLQNLGKPGQHFSPTLHHHRPQLPRAPRRRRSRRSTGSRRRAGADAEPDARLRQGAEETRPGSGSPGPPAGRRAERINFEHSTISGVDTSTPDLALVTPSQISGSLLGRRASAHQAVISAELRLRAEAASATRSRSTARSSRVVGIANPPLGGQTSDIYLPLGELQKLSDREGRVNVLRVRADSADQVDAVARSDRGRSPAPR